MYGIRLILCKKLISGSYNELTTRSISRLEHIYNSIIQTECKYVTIWIPPNSYDQADIFDIRVHVDLVALLFFDEDIPEFQQ